MTTSVALIELLDRRAAALEAVQKTTDPARLPTLRQNMRSLVADLFAADRMADIHALHFALTWREKDLRDA